MQKLQPLFCFHQIKKSDTFANMKTWKLLPICAIAMTFSSCGGDDKPTGTENEPKEKKKEAINHEEASAEIYKELFAELKPDGKDELLLLGIAADSTLSTLAISAVGGKDEHHELPYIATPKKDGFWYLQYFRWKHISFTESPFEENEMVPNEQNHQELAAEKSPEALKKKLASKKRYQKDAEPKSGNIGDMGFYTDAQTTLQYVTNKYITQHTVISEFAGGAHPMNGDNLYTIPFDQFTKKQENTDLTKQIFKTCFSDKEWKAMSKRLFARGQKGDFDDLLGDERVDGREVDTTQIYMAFERGTGAVFGRFMADAPTMYIESGDYNFTAGELYDKPFCNKLVPANEVPASLSDLPRKTGCKDFVLSPGQNILIVLYVERAEVVDVATGKILQTITMRKDWNIVMVEWDTGDFAKKWWDTVVK